eukprot:c40124_g1_i1.p1 GENE.c40124_g1_i1~~c40124_g1_i1.p1  ORF type:complete len:267 (+),score=52.54 c40124_g1_i1:47-847(+)
MLGLLVLVVSHAVLGSIVPNGAVPEIIQDDMEEDESALQTRPGALNNPQLVGQLLLGAIFGSAVGTISSSSAIASSGDTPEAQDAVGSMWAGMLAGLMAAYKMQDSPKNRDVTKPPDVRLKSAGEAFQNGAVAGMISGAFAQVLSGSSDEGGSFFSSQSSSSSSSQNQQQPQAQEGPDLKRAPASSMVVAQTSAIRTAIAGGMGGLVVQFFEPEILTLASVAGSEANQVVSNAKNLAMRAPGQAQQHLDRVKARLQAKIDAAKAEK